MQKVQTLVQQNPRNNITVTASGELLKNYIFGDLGLKNHKKEMELTRGEDRVFVLKITHLICLGT